MTYNDFWRKLTPLYDDGEAKAIARMVLEYRFGMTVSDILCGKVTQLSAENADSLLKISDRLRHAEPVQYVLGTADFCGRAFHVEPGVLIPRPETEQLCRIITAETPSSTHILDVGTGSGCIAITLALDILQSNVEAWDISSDALRIAQDNAKTLEANVTFHHQDALQAPHDVALWDVVVSNPPYICDKERSLMARNVLDYEPDTALFVPDSDPLLFYRAISEYASKALKEGGMLYFEINPIYSADMETMLQALHFEAIEVINDEFDKQRYIKAQHR